MTLTPHAQPEVKRLYTVKPSGELDLFLHPGQTRAWLSTARFVIMLAGTQGGKTSFLPHLLNREAMRWGYQGDYLAVTATYKLFNQKFLPEMLLLFEHLLGIGRYWPGLQIIELRNPETGQFLARRAQDPMWGRILLGSASAPSSVESSTARAAICDELGMDEFTLNIWDGIISRLSIFQGRLFGGTTLYNLGWLKQEVYDKAAQKGIDIIQFDSTANPAFPMAEFLAREREMENSKFKMRYKGQYDNPPGMIYQDFNFEYVEQGGHRVKPFDLPREWPRYVAVDPGGVNVAILFFAHDTQRDVYYLYREIHEGGKSTPEYVARVKQLAADGGERIIKYFVGGVSETQIRRDWTAAGATATKPAVDGVEEGIERGIRLIRQHRIYIFDSCRLTLDQFGRYSRVVDENNVVTDKIKDKETFHFLDAYRYFAVGVTGPRGVGFA